MLLDGAVLTKKRNTYMVSPPSGQKTKQERFKILFIPRSRRLNGRVRIPLFGEVGRDVDDAANEL